MAYSFQDRLEHNRVRFDQVSTEAVLFTPLSGLPIPIVVSPIHRRAFTLTTQMSAITSERQYFAYDLTQNMVTLPLPRIGDAITRANGDVYKIVPEDDNLPPFQYTTSKQNRVMVYAILESKG